MKRKLRTGILATAAFAAAMLAASTKAHDEARPLLRDGFALVASGGGFPGFTLGARAGSAEIGAAVGAGWVPLLAVWQRDETGARASFGSSALVRAELYATPWRVDGGSAVGLRAGYRYNTVLGHGLGAAMSLRMPLAPSLAAEFLIGPALFPGGSDALRRELELPENATVLFGSALMYIGFGAELQLYP